MKSLPSPSRRPAPAAPAVILAVALLSCGDSATPPAAPEGPARGFSFDTTRLCALVPARDSTPGGPPPGPVEVFGTDLGWTYEVNGTIPILFGDTWQRVDECPIQTNDDALGVFHVPGDGWPGYEAEGSIPDDQCPDITYELDATGASFAPITLRRWDGVAVPLGPLNTPLTGFFDGETEWGIFIVAGGQSCTEGSSCPSDLSSQAADLACGLVGGRSLCTDPTSTRSGDSAEAFYLHVAERVGPSEYVSRALFLTNKYLNLTARAVRVFDPEGSGRQDYAPGRAALLVWGRPGFQDLSGDGPAPPYFLYHPLPFRRSGDRIVFEPRYLTALDDGRPAFGASQADAIPLYAEEFEPVNQVAISWLAPLGHWLMIYGGSSTDLADPAGAGGRGQPVAGALHARVAASPWGPWSEPTPVLTNEQTAQDLVCGHQAPEGCLAQPDPRIRPACIEAVDPASGGSLYGANIIDSMTRARPSAGGAAVDVFWNYSTWHPYGVTLARTRVEFEGNQ